MSLRSDTIRLAHSNPELRPHLLPLLKQAVRFQKPQRPGTIWYGRFPAAYEMEGAEGRGTNGEFKVLKVEDRYTMFGSQPLVPHMLLEDHKGNREWVPPWGPMGLGQPKQRDDIETIASKFHGKFKQIGWVRKKSVNRGEREWGPQYGRPSDDQRSAAIAILDKMPFLRRVKEGSYTLDWPVRNGTQKYEIYTGGDGVRLHRARL